MTILRTPRLTLRPPRMADLDAFHAMLSDARVMRFWATLPHTRLEQSREWLTAMITVPPEDGIDWVVEHEGRAIGKAGLWRYPWIGFLFHPDVWGRGFASEAVAAVIDDGFARRGLAAIDADVDPRNVASLRLLGKLGFVETGRAQRTLRLGEEWCDSVYLRRSAVPAPDSGRGGESTG